MHPSEEKKELTEATVNFYRQFVKEGDVAIDIGAHTGDTTVPMAVAAGASGTVFGVEPNPYVYKILEKNSALNLDTTHIVPLNFAATEEDGTFTFLYSDAAFCNGGNLSTIQDQRHKHNFPLEVQGRNLTNFLQKEHAEALSRLTFIKVDTEGYDRAVIDSLKEIICERKPVLVGEVHKRLTLEERKALFDLVTGFGYEVFKMEEGGKGEKLSDQNLLKEKHYDLIAFPL